MSDVADGLDFGREFEILFNSCAGGDAFVENVLLELPTCVFSSLCFQAFVFVKRDATGENGVDTLVHVTFVIDLIGN